MAIFDEKQKKMAKKAQDFVVNKNVFPLLIAYTVHKAISMTTVCDSAIFQTRSQRTE